MELSLGFKTDSDGYLSRQCEVCEKRFKVLVSEDGDYPKIIHCPYCGDNEQGDGNCFTEEQSEYINAVLSKKYLDPTLDEFSDDMEKLNKPGSLISFSIKRESSPEPVSPTEPEEVMAMVELKTSGLKIKLDSEWKGVVYDISTGETQSFSVEGGADAE